MQKLIGLLVGAVVLAGCGGSASATPASSKGTAVATVAPPSTGPLVTPAGPSPSAGGPRRLPDGPLVPGTYSVLGGRATFDVAVAGWESCCNAFGAIKSDVVALLFEDITDGIVYADSCKWKAGPNVEPTGAQAFARRSPRR